MKVFCFLLVLMVALVGCGDQTESPSMSVDRYVQLLAAGNYKHGELPDFSSNDISELLSYRNDTRVISGFPVNLISSAYTPEVTLGMYVLWTIESIRARSIGSKFLVGTFPSQNPILELRATFQVVEQSNDLQQEIADAYFDWWEQNKKKNFREFHEVDPLENTDYKWH